MLANRIGTSTNRDSDAEKEQRGYEQLIIGVAKRLASMRDVEIEDRVKPLTERHRDLASLRQLMHAISLDGGGKPIPNPSAMEIPGGMHLACAVRSLEVRRKAPLHAKLYEMLTKAESLLPKS